MIITRKQFEEEVARRVGEIQRQEYLERRMNQVEENVYNLRTRLDGIEWKVNHRGEDPGPVATCCKSE